MYDQERLEEIKKHWCDYTLKGMDIDWLIQQAEEKQELEMLRKQDAKDYAQLHYFLNGRTNRLGESVVNIIIDLVKDLEQQNKRYEEGLYALHHMATESEADFMIDITTDLLQGFEIVDHYKEDAEKGKELINELLQNK
ncbi:hypothetical protein [Gracilibacillus lacisalsi]|uniref:hypothetical protein n=1 Tax=Gracilibacillus lacisalsi TaxID=393087 RepID=UPI000367F7F2|nr:hypothetical protein [Gracilibacillus lacisalsi]